MASKKNEVQVRPTDDSVTEQERVEMALAERYPAGCLEITVDTPIEQWPSSFEPGSRAFKAAVLNAMLTPDVQVAESWSEPYLVTDWIRMIRETVDARTGEIRKYPWLALFCKDGEIIGTSSDVAPHQFARGLRQFTAAEWKEGIPWQIRAKKSRTSPGYYHQLRVAL